jgi:G:T-mismatch repair DNA endonuclease (very short patch repair protein)
MATTLQNLIDAIEADLADSGNATWAAADIQQWCRDAIADYSTHFPRTLTEDITTAANDRKYDLPAGFIEVLTVEYPSGQDPPEYLARRPHDHPNFWIDSGYFDIVERDDDTDVSEIWISEKPAASETVSVLYHAIHLQDTTDLTTSDNLTVRERHHYILKKYVFWQAYEQLKATEQASPTSNSSLLMSQLAINVDRNRRAYIDALAKAVFSRSKSAAVSWDSQAAESTRIY